MHDEPPVWVVATPSSKVASHLRAGIIRSPDPGGPSVEVWKFECDDQILAEACFDDDNLPSRWIRDVSDTRAMSRRECARVMAPSWQPLMEGERRSLPLRLSGQLEPKVESGSRGCRHRDRRSFPIAKVTSTGTRVTPMKSRRSQRSDMSCRSWSGSAPRYPLQGIHAVESSQC